MIFKKYVSVVFILFVLLYSHLVYAEDNFPKASNVSINSGESAISLTEGTTTDVVVTAVVTADTAEACENISGVTVVFYNTTVGDDAGDNNNDHYTVDTQHVIVQNPCIGMTATYTATIPVWYYADPSEWTAEVIPTGGTADSTTIKINKLRALEVNDTLNFGEMALNTDTGDWETSTTITNTGNTSIGVQIYGFGLIGNDGMSMACTHGDIGIAYEKYNTTAETPYADKISISNMASVIEGFTIDKRTDLATEKDLYWGFGLPINGVGGSCKGTIVFTAI